MARQIVLLRGINIGPHNRVAMPELRRLLEEEGFADVQTYVQSGNVVLSTDLPAAELARRCERAIADRFGLDIAVVARSRDELAEVVRRDPLGDVVSNPKRYQVSFLADELDPAVAERVAAAAAEPERCAIFGREIYAWHPEGVARSPLSTLLAGRSLGVTATARNWTTVNKLLEMADA